MTRNEKILKAIDELGAEPFSVTDIAALTGTSRETVRRVFHALKDYRFLRYQGRGFAGRNWYRRPVEPPTDDVLQKMLDLRRKERRWLTQARSTSTSKSAVSRSQPIAS